MSGSNFIFGGFFTIEAGMGLLALGVPDQVPIISAARRRSVRSREIMRVKSKQSWLTDADWLQWLF